MLKFLTTSSFLAKFPPDNPDQVKPNTTHMTCHAAMFYRSSRSVHSTAILAHPSPVTYTPQATIHDRFITQYPHGRRVLHKMLLGDVHLHPIVSTYTTPSAVRSPSSSRGGAHFTRCSYGGRGYHTCSSLSLDTKHRFSASRRVRAYPSQMQMSNLSCIIFPPSAPCDPPALPLMELAGAKRA